ETKRLPSLLTDRNTSRGLRSTVTKKELVRIGVSLNGCAELLSGNQVEVLDVVGVQRCGLCARGRLGDSGQTIPSVTDVVDTVRRNVQYTSVDTGLVETLTDPVPSKYSHDYFLSRSIEYRCGDSGPQRRRI